MKRLCVALATYNEAENLPAVLEGILRAAPNASVVVVDDDSPDGTGAVADDWAARDPRVHVIHRKSKLGYATAHVAAADYAVREGACYIVTMDADLSHDPEALPQLVSALEHADVAVGSRYVPGGRTVGWPLRRRLLSRWGNWAFRFLGGLPVRDGTSGFRAYRVEALRRIDLASLPARGYALLTLSLRRCQEERLRVVEVPITFVDRRWGRSKMSGSILREQLWLLCRLAFTRRRRR